MKTRIFRVKQCTLFASACFSLLVSDPTDFFFKVQERVRQALDGKELFGRWKEFHGPNNRFKSNRLVNENFRDLLSKVIALSWKPRHFTQHFDLNVPLTCSDDYRISEHANYSGEQLTVLHLVTNSFPHTISGYSVRTHGLLRALTSQDIKLVTYTRLAYPFIVGKISSSEGEWYGGVEYRRLLPWYLPITEYGKIVLSIRMLSRVIDREKPNLIHTTTDFRNGIIAGTLSSQKGIPWIYEVRGHTELSMASNMSQEELLQENQKSLLLNVKKQETKCMSAADCVLALSQASKQEMISRGINAAKIKVVPNCISEQRFEKRSEKDTLRRKFQIPDNPVIGIVSSLVHYEGIDLLVRVAARFPDCYFVIVGDGVERRRLEALAVSVGVKDRIRFTGKVAQEAVSEWYAILDVFVAPRRNLDVCRLVTPIKTLEAQAMGIPLVCADLPALREVTGNFAFYFSPENLDSLEEKICDAISGEAFTQDGAIWARTQSFEKQSLELAKIYKTIVESNKSVEI